MKKQEKNISRFIIAFAIGCLFIFACKKDPIVSGENDAKIRLHTEHFVDTKNLLFDTLMYENAAGERYSVSRLEYYISDIVLLKTGGDYAFPMIQYLNPKSNAAFEIELNHVGIGDYHGIRFNIGLDSLHNIPNGLPPTIENNNMFWPIQMGGGYHFMKLEGQFQNDTQLNGYAIHLGKNKHLVSVEILKNFTVSKAEHQMVLEMNINEWYKNPEIFSFIKDGKYTMSSDVLMKKIADNGKDVFTLKWLP